MRVNLECYVRAIVKCLLFFFIGSVEFTVQKAIKIKGLRMIVKGKTKVARPVGNNFYIGSEKHMNYPTQLIPSESGKPQEISAGLHAFKFSYKIPENAPATVVKGVGKFALIEYKVKVRLDVPSLRKINVEREFTVEREMDLNLDPALSKVCSFQEVLPLRNLCCTTKLVEIKVKIPKFGYVRMEKIPFTVEVAGVEGKFPVKKFQIKLQRISKCVSVKPTEKEMYDVKTEVSTFIPFVLEGDFLRISSSIEVPEACPISNQKYGKLYHISYVLNFNFISDGCKKSVTITARIDIGTIPIK